MDQVMYLIKMMKDSGRQLIGFDLCEVSDGDSAAGLDALYGARVLFKLCNFMVG
jgi:agmatinase